MHELKILVVDDETETLEYLAKQIERFLKCAVYKSDSGQDAIDKMAGIDFDLVILDIKMPEVNGLDVMRETSKIKKLPDILVVTAWDSAEVVDEVIAAGAIDYIPKPVSSETLLEKVKTILEKKGKYIKKEG